VDRIMTMDLHADQLQGFFDVPVDHLFAAPVVLDWLEQQEYSNITVVSPDAGGVERARALAKRLKAPLAIIDKRRADVNVAEVLHIIGDVEGWDCLMVDDLIDTAGTLVKGVEALLAHGAKSVSAVATHPVLSGPALERIADSPITQLVVADTIDISDRDLPANVHVVSTAALFAVAIGRITHEESVSALFATEPDPTDDTERDTRRVLEACDPNRSTSGS